VKFLRSRSVVPSKLAGAFRRAPTEELTAIVKVSEDGYVPHGVTLRTRIADRIFTATLTGSQLQRLEDDPRVLSIESSRRLRTPS
jgi:hypothetical protein